MKSHLHQKGTVVEKVTEETLRDWNHLQELLSACEGKALYKVQLLLDQAAFLHILITAAAQRRIGETSLNERSSRSHQIIRLVCSVSFFFSGLSIFQLNSQCAFYYLILSFHNKFCRQLKVLLESS